MIILGLHRDPWHNAGVAIIREDAEGVRFASLSEERANREKDSRKFPHRSLKACLDDLEISSPEEIDLVVLDYIVRPDWSNDWYREPSEANNFLREFDPRKIRVINHHLAHAYAVFYSSGFETAAVLIVDGRGSEKETQSLFAATQDKIELIESTTAIGIGLLYAAVTQAIGFGLLQEGKTMGLAPYGAAVNKQIFQFPRRYAGVATDYSSVCVQDSYEMGAPHAPIVTFDDKARAAFEVQEETEAALLHLAEHAFNRTGADHLCISGGVALNSVANYKVLRSGIFKDIFINPAASDTGIPLGAALYGYHAISRRNKSYPGISPYLGPSYSDERITAAIEAYRGSTFNQEAFEGFSLANQNALELAVQMLADNRIVARFHGRSETGPRALGNRSILMSPVVAENKDILNRDVKHREAFRPFAPAILEEFAHEYFEIDRPSPYMLLVPPAREGKRDRIPAVIHVDETGRLQTVSKTSNQDFYSLIEQFHQKTGVPVLLNTSFNVANEPIVETPEDAIRCFLSTGIDALLIGDYLLVKENKAGPV
ncbi:MAG TPA: carbamoyltransferase C-terminal domain-containing protein [Chthoniobacterales bacterium]|nr:carbamoyltransferase C-terminal domain-containing protein [Chthoniobacterales bacterium]